MGTQHETDFPGFIAAVLAACPLCPKCGGALYRVPPRFVDQLFSPARYRFQCQSAECYWIGNLPIEGTNSTRFGLFHGLIAGSIVVIVASVALGLFGLFTIHRERAEVAATHNQSPATTPSIMVVDDPKGRGGVLRWAYIGRLDVPTGALKGTKPAGAAPELPAHPVPVGAMAGVRLQPKEAISEELLACIKAVRSDPATWRSYQKQGTHSKHLEDQSKATPEEVQALTVVFDRTKKCYATHMAAAQKTGGADLATADSYEAFHAEMMVEAARLAKGEITWGVYNERCLERGTKSWEELKTRLAAIQTETNQAEATTLQP